MTPDGCKMKRVQAILEGRIGIGTVIQKDAGDVDRACPRRTMQRSTSFGLAFYIRTPLQQQLDGVELGLLNRKV